MQFNIHLEFKAWDWAQVKAGMKDAFRKVPDRAMVKVQVKAILKISIELHRALCYLCYLRTGILPACTSSGDANVIQGDHGGLRPGLC